jgi:2-polyprenyl-3-methyl-5-hydroxy-6-metoxy-1,4-benzoquinol methylase
VKSFKQIKPQKGARPIEWTSERIESFWDFESNFPERYFTYHNGDALLRFAERHVEHDGIVADFGAGSGILFEKLLKRGVRAVAIEISPESQKRLEAIAKKYPKVSQGVFTTEEAAASLAGKCSVVYLVEVIEHLDVEARAAVLRNVLHLLKPGGHLVLSTPNDECLEDSLILEPSTGRFFHRWQHLFSFTYQDLVVILSKAGFSEVRTMTLNFGRNRVVSFLKWLRAFLRRDKDLNLVAIARK